MRLLSGVTDQYLYFVAVDSTDYVTRKTGLSSFTVYRSRNGGAATAYTTPTVTELSAANMPGVYKFLIDEDMTIDSGDDSQEVCLHITATGMAPVTRVFELYRPKATAGETLTIASGLGAADVTNWKGASAPAMTGDAFARLGAPAGASVSADVAAVKVDTAAIKAKTDNLPSDPADESLIIAATDALASSISAVGTTTDAIKLKTDNLPTDPADESALEALITAQSAPTANENADALLDRADGIETSFTLRQAMRLVLAVLAGKASGLTSTVAVYRDVNDTTDRIVATVDADGNRTSITRDVT